MALIGVLDRLSVFAEGYLSMLNLEFEHGELQLRYENIDWKKKFFEKIVSSGKDIHEPIMINFRFLLSVLKELETDEVSMRIKMPSIILRNVMEGETDMEGQLCLVVLMGMKDSFKGTSEGFNK